MMTNLFSTFDPSTDIFILSLNWTSTFIGLLLIPSLFWLTPSRINLMWNKLNLNLYNDFFTLFVVPSFNGTTFIFFFSIFIMMFFNFFLGFSSFFFSSSRFVVFLLIALPMWLSFMLFLWIFNTKLKLAHLVPQGAPLAVLFFMVFLVAIISIILRPTMLVRLAANMIAGHLLLTLLGNTGTSISINMMTILIISQMLLLMLESAVALIQAYVFSILSILYSSESH
uniref:ATP synthase subunit a n=1 Tax=Yunnanites coriacea TaxID=369694 RepID=A0A7L9QD18_9ORTH|nr:ATP synthase F0 subunit 6 [Yunnanites coriacea]